MKILRVLNYTLPPVIWMSLIFYFSSREAVSASSDYVANAMILKTLHVVAYGFLYGLLFRAYYGLAPKLRDTTKLFIYPALIAILYAFSDEYHQTFVPNRSGTLIDVGIDGIGIIIAMIVIYKLLPFIKRFL